MIKTSKQFRILLYPIAIITLGCLISFSFASKANRFNRSLKQILQDTSNIIQVIHADITTADERNNGNQMILEGNVVLQQGKTIFKANKAIKDNLLNTFEAWGRVHINDNDTTDIYSDHLKYMGNTQIADLDGNVKLTDGMVTLTTPTLQYDMTTNIGTYNKGGTVVNKKTVITSKEGEYYRDIQDVYFKKNVIVNDPAYHITSDSLKYNTGTQVATFITMTHIKDSARRSIDTKEGFYNLKTGQAQFGQRPFINDDNKSTLNADKVYLDDNIAKAEGNAIAVDSVRGTIIIANTIFQNRINEAILATQKPVMIIKQDNDSIYVAADTLFSAKLSELFEAPHPLHKKDSIRIAKDEKDSSYISSNEKDSIVETETIRKSAQSLSTNFNKPKITKSDSTDRYFEAFHNVRIYSDSMQAVCDSMFYSFKDSTFRMYNRPVVWGKESQITGDTILLHTKNKQPFWMEAYRNGFMINRVAGPAFNQIKASRIDAFFSEGNLDSVKAVGSPERIYFVTDQDTAFIGVHFTTADAMYFQFKDKELYKVLDISNIKSTMYPIKEKKPSEARLEGYIWREAERPKTKYELFE